MFTAANSVFNGAAEYLASICELEVNGVFFFLEVLKHALSPLKPIVDKITSPSIFRKIVPEHVR